jgi:hypothetical protein
MIISYGFIHKFSFTLIVFLILVMLGGLVLNIYAQNQENKSTKTTTPIKTFNRYLSRECFF